MRTRRALAAVTAVSVTALAGCGVSHAAVARQPPYIPAPTPSTAVPTSPPATHAPRPGQGKPSASPTANGIRAPKTVPAKPPTSAPASTPSGYGPHGEMKMNGTQAVALTFDDGPSPEWTPKILGLLRQYGVKATFCLIGVNVQAHPELVQAIVRDGHTLCNHTWRHDLTLGNRSAAEIRADLQRTNDAIHAAVPGARIAYFRHPGGNFTNNAVAIARDMGMASIHWDVDPQDWRKPPAPAIVNVVVSHTKPGSIVLLHDGGGERPNTYTACQTILPNLQGRFTLIALP